MKTNSYYILAVVLLFALVALSITVSRWTRTYDENSGARLYVGDPAHAGQLMEKKMAEQMGFEIRINASHSEAITRVTEALKTEGFGVLTRADVDQAFRDKLGVEFSPYTILGACNPQLAHVALSSQPEIGLMLPCNVTVEAVDDGCIVRIVNPAAMMQMGDLGSDEAIAKVASDATERLQRVAEVLSTHQ